ncbi:unnamed protein product [Colias eurytheme]|nr:unnamed protein product [Colias eurytheme]
MRGYPRWHLRRQRNKNGIGSECEPITLKSFKKLNEKIRRGIKKEKKLANVQRMKRRNYGNSGEKGKIGKKLNLKIVKKSKEMKARPLMIKLRKHD